MKCVECGEQIEFRWIEERNQELRERQLCFTDNYWFEQSQCRDNAVVTPTYEHYRIEPEDGRGFRGFGGHRFTISFFGGPQVESTNLWGQGEVPERWRNRITPNAEVVG